MAKKKTKKKRAVRRQRRSSKSRRVQWERLTAEALEETRVALGLTKVEWAERLGTSNSSYHNWLNGVAVPSLDRQARLAQILEDAAAMHRQAIELEQERVNAEPEARLGPGSNPDPSPEAQRSTLRALTSIVAPPGSRSAESPPTEPAVRLVLAEALVKGTSEIVAAALAAPGVQISPRGIPTLVTQVRAALAGHPAPSTPTAEPGARQEGV